MKEHLEKIGEKTEVEVLKNSIITALNTALDKAYDTFLSKLKAGEQDDDDDRLGFRAPFHDPNEIKNILISSGIETNDLIIIARADEKSYENSDPNLGPNGTVYGGCYVEILKTEGGEKHLIFAKWYQDEKPSHDY